MRVYLLHLVDTVIFMNNMPLIQMSSTYGISRTSSRYVSKTVGHLFGLHALGVIREL